jgi:hypothetical protein
MRENKLLAMAIASALSIGSTATVQASSLLLIDPTGADSSSTDPSVVLSDGISASAPTYAAELFKPTGTDPVIPARDSAKSEYSSDTAKGDLKGSAGGQGHRYRVVYDIDDSLGRIPFNFEITFTLDGGNVTWGNFVDAGLLSAGGDVDLYKQGDGFNDPTNDGAEDTLPEVSKVFGGEDTDNSVTADNEGTTVTFLVQAEQNPIHAGSVHFEFMFDIDDANILNTAGGIINLSASTDVGDTPSSIPIARSANGSEILIKPDPNQSSEAAIDVTQGATMFTSDTSPGPLGVRLGSLAIQDLSGSSTVVSTDATSAYTFDGQEATFTIIDGPFCASAAGSEVENPVFLDMNNTGIFEEGTDIPATFVQGSNAEWELTQTDLDSIHNKSPAPDIVALVDGETVICEQPVAPTATLQITYATGKTIVSGSLFHIKRNGTICTLYNIPSPPAFDNSVPPKDRLNIRIINRSTQAAALTATLRTMGGDPLCQDFELGSVEPNATLHLNQDEVVAKANEQAGCEDVATWENRAVLTISSDAPDGSLQIFGMLRNKGGGPLTNLSLGATGNGCD